MRDLERMLAFVFSTHSAMKSGSRSQVSSRRNLRGTFFESSEMAPGKWFMALHLMT